MAQDKHRQRLDRLQVAAFHARYKSLHDEKKGCPEMAFAQAIVETSDDRFAHADPAKVEQWLREYCCSRGRDN